MAVVAATSAAMAGASNRYPMCTRVHIGVAQRVRGVPLVQVTAGFR
ncbi:hypothetical protein SALBM311S_01662 [Streptomyces alboniger]